MQKYNKNADLQLFLSPQFLTNFFNCILTTILANNYNFVQITDNSTMRRLTPVFFFLTCLLSLTGCQNKFDAQDYKAYFGGEILNPNNRYIVFLKDNVVIDSMLLDEKNRFFFAFDSLAPGMYTFKNEPEFQNVYFDKNDSIMVNMNAKKFDHSIVFCGRGDLKNNFLMDLYLKNEEDKNEMFYAYDKDIKEFKHALDSTYDTKLDYYKNRKEVIQWSEGFDFYVKTLINYNYYTKLELYPYIHQRRTAQDVKPKLPKNYYDFRKNINLNDERIINYQPFSTYLTAMLNNLAYKDCMDEDVNTDKALECNIVKLELTNKLFNTDKIKNSILNNIAFMYLLEDQNLLNNEKFLKAYFKYSTDNSKHNEILKISKAAQKLKPNTPLPDEILIDYTGEKQSLRSMINKQTVLFFWSKKSLAHFESAHIKVEELKKKFPNTQFFSINIDDDYREWQRTLNDYNLDPTVEFHATNYKNSKEKWVITKIQRTMIINADGTIKNAFVNLFDSNFIQLLP